MKKIEPMTLIFLVLVPFYTGSVEKEKILEVLVDGTIPNKGQVILSIFDSHENYLKSPLKRFVQKVADSHVVLFDINDLREGSYSVSAVYDEDGNGLLNTGFLGMPSEKIGFSNNAKSHFGPPSFEETLFEFHSSMKITIYLDKANSGQEK
ncbi:MAG: DUF2141 domain-containing protein [Candidatus Thiodiazotropha sp.]